MPETEYIAPFGIPRLHRLRWRFDFNGKPSRYGQWSNPGNIEKEGAWCVNKDGLVRASVEQECLNTWNVRTVAECDGHDFVNFEWMNLVEFGNVIGLNGDITRPGTVVGLTLVTRELELTCMVNGEQKVKSRSESDKKFHLAGFGR